jgi:hypothetical protein
MSCHSLATEKGALRYHNRLPKSSCQHRGEPSLPLDATEGKGARVMATENQPAVAAAIPHLNLVPTRPKHTHHLSRDPTQATPTLARPAPPCGTGCWCVPTRPPARSAQQASAGRCGLAHSRQSLLRSPGTGGLSRPSGRTRRHATPPQERVRTSVSTVGREGQLSHLVWVTGSKSSQWGLFSWRSH